MEDKNIQDNVSASLPVKGSGSMLAAARKKQNKTVEEIASELNLAVHQIRTIELDQTDGLPEPTYVRGYIRSYANLLGLDVEKVLLAYLNPNWQKSSKLDEMPRGIGSANERVQSKSFKPVWMALFLLVCGGAAFLWFSGILKEKYDLFVDTDLSQTDYVVLGDDQSNDISIQASANVADEGVDRNFVSTPSEPNNLNNPAGVIAGDLEPNDDADDFVEEGEQSSDNELLTDEEIAANDVDVTTSEAGNNDAQEQVIINSEDQLVLNFTQTSWIDIRDQDNGRLAYKSYAPGEVLKVSNDGPMSVFIGNAEGVTVKFNGDDFGIEQYREGVYAKFIVNEN